MLVAIAISSCGSGQPEQTSRSRGGANPSAATTASGQKPAVKIATPYRDGAFRCPIQARTVGSILMAKIQPYGDGDPGEGCSFAGDGFTVVVLRHSGITAGKARTHFESNDRLSVADRADLGPGGFEIAGARSLTLEFTPVNTSSTWAVEVGLTEDRTMDRTDLEEAAIALISAPR
jgi:hypothetical protein